MRPDDWQIPTLRFMRLLAKLGLITPQTKRSIVFYHLMPGALP